MKKLALIFVFLFSAGAYAQVALKQQAVAAIDKQSKELIAMSDQIWRFAELALRETKSSKLLADYAEAQGFRVERGVSGMPTAFIATYGEGKPVIGIMGEYDALPGISQKASSVKEPLEPEAGGHGCGHNLFGAASIGSAVAVKELIAAGKLKGTIKFFGTPAEESVGGKIYMARDGVFSDVDVMLAWHPSTETQSDTGSSQAIIDFNVEFSGKAAHAAYDPWNGRSALDAAEIFLHALNMMREHVKPTVRIHYTIQQGGQVPNVIPEKAKLWVWVRDSKHQEVDKLMKRFEKMTQGAALAADVEGNLSIQGGDWEMLVNLPGQQLLHSNLEWLGPLKFTPEEHQFAKEIQKATGVEPKGLSEEIKAFENKIKEPEGGSTDVADVSWIVPVIHLSVATAPLDAPWHAWPVVACGGMSIGHKGMLYASKALAATMVDLYANAKQREAIRAEFARQTKGIEYKAYIPEGPPVPRDTAK